MRVPRLPRVRKRDAGWWHLALVVNILAAPANYALVTFAGGQVLLLVPIIKALTEQVHVRGYFANIASNAQRLTSGAIDRELILRFGGICVIPLCLIPVCAIAILRARRPLLTPPPARPYPPHRT